MAVVGAGLRRTGALAFALACAAGASVAYTSACKAPGSDAYNPPPVAEAGAGTGDAGADVATGPVALPFTVSDEFQASGAMGDGPTNIMGVMISNDSTQCLQPRVTGALGDCYTFSWTPVFLPKANSAWAGLYWQYPNGNWGEKDGLAIQPGASKVTFAAAGVNGGEQVEFIVGGINVTPSDAGLSHKDTFKASKLVTLTKEWATYEVPIGSSDSYTTVLGGFAWAITAGGTSTFSFYVDNIQWEP
jgi:hypothetical protein